MPSKGKLKSSDTRGCVADRAALSAAWRGALHLHQSRVTLRTRTVQRRRRRQRQRRPWRRSFPPTVARHKKTTLLIGKARSHSGSGSRADFRLFKFDFVFVILSSMFGVPFIHPSTMYTPGTRCQKQGNNTSMSTTITRGEEKKKKMKESKKEKKKTTANKKTKTDCCDKQPDVARTTCRQHLSQWLICLFAHFPVLLIVLILISTT